MLLPFSSISVVILIRTDTTLDLSQKAEKVCLWCFADPNEIATRVKVARVFAAAKIPLSQAFTQRTYGKVINAAACS